MNETDGEALWTWSLNVYADSAVKAALLAMQNRFGAHVPLVLWAAHAAQTGASVTQDDARAARAALSSLSIHTRALRDARRQLPELTQRLPAGPREAAIAHIAEAEIALEQLELAKLAEQRTHSDGPKGLQRLEGNLAAALNAAGIDLGKHDAKAALDALATTLGAHFTA
jgi:uncharacterized protein (TIGR02444 family)